MGTLTLPIALIGALCLASPLAAQARAPVPAQRDGMFRQFAPGLLARINYQADSAGPYRIAIWDLLVGPGQRMTAPATLPGGAVLEVRTGTGRIEIDGAVRELRGGGAFVVHQGSRFVITNGREDAALAIRVTLIAASGR